jgi:hypothetical protein
MEWMNGFDAGQDFVLAMIKDLAGVEFKTVTELITFVRQSNDRIR